MRKIILPLILSLNLVLGGFIVNYFFQQRKAQAVTILPTMSLRKGWNMISSPDKLYKKENISGCTIKSGPWFYNATSNKYEKVQQIYPLTGYWLKVTDACTLNLADGMELPEKKQGLNAGWNMISTILGKSWNDVKNNCQMSDDEPHVLWHWDGAQYLQLGPAEKMEPPKGYWVKVKSACVIDDTKTSQGDNEQCYQKLGPPSEVCSPPTISGSGSNTKCNYFEPKCETDQTGSVKWSCQPKSQEIPPNLPNNCTPSCTEGGWETVSCSNDSNLQINVCNLIPSLVSSVVGNLLINDKNLSSLVGHDTVVMIKVSIDFYFWLKAHGIDPASLLSNPAEFNAKLSEFFIAKGTDLLIRFGKEKIKEAIVQFAADLKINPQLMIELTNFFEFVIRKKGSITIILSMDVSQIQLLVTEYIQETGSVTMKDFTDFNLIKTVALKLSSITGIDYRILATAGRLLEYLIQTKNMDINVIISISIDELDTLIQEFIAKRLEKFSGIPSENLRKVLQILISTNLIAQIPNFDISKGVSCQTKPSPNLGITCSILGINIIDIAVNATFNCPLDPTSFACQALNPANWRAPDVNNLEVYDDNPNDLKIGFRWGGLAHPAQFKLCDIPNVNVSILGNVVFSGINFKLGPAQIDGPALWIDMPTSCKLKPGDPPLYNGEPNGGAGQLNFKRGINHIYPMVGNYMAEASCQLGFDIFGWSKDTSQKPINISNTEGWKMSQITLYDFDRKIGTGLSYAKFERDFNVTQETAISWEWAITNRYNAACGWSGFAIWNGSNKIISAGSFLDEYSHKPNIPVRLEGKFDAQPGTYTLQLQSCYNSFGRVMYK